MKKSLKVLLLLGVFSLCTLGLTNAGSLTLSIVPYYEYGEDGNGNIVVFTGDDSYYPSYLGNFPPLSSLSDYLSVDYNGATNCSIQIGERNGEVSCILCAPNTPDCSYSTTCSDYINGGPLRVDVGWYGGLCTGATITSPFIVNSSSSGGGFLSSLLPNGVSDLSPIVDGLQHTIDEFIPYIVYIGLGVLGIIIGFFGIKWLLNYVKGNTLSVFSSRRKK